MTDGRAAGGTVVVVHENPNQSTATYWSLGL